MNIQIDSISNAVRAVTKKWSSQRKREKRDSSRLQRRREVWHAPHKTTIKDAAWQVMKSAYLKASGGGNYPAGARQVMYAARSSIQTKTGTALNDEYFTQRLLPDFMRDNPEMTEYWDVVFDARGHLWEPHTDIEVALGTIDVRRYLKESASHQIPAVAGVELESAFPTSGARHRYGAILFIEKEGFMPLFKKIHLAERYDIAIMSTKGLSTTASRSLVDEICGGKRKIPLLVLHDFDKSGLSIKSTLHQDTRRYSFENDVNIIDLGVRIEDVRAYNLESEDVHYGSSDPRENLKENGATNEEIDFLCAGCGTGWYGRRVELNAFTSDQMVEWIEAKLQQHGIKKVIPDATTLDEAYRRSAAVHYLNDQIASLQHKAADRATTVAIPSQLNALVTGAIARNAELSWDQAVAELAREAA